MNTITPQAEKALIIGVGAPSKSVKYETLALDPHDTETRRKLANNSAYHATHVGDILELPTSQIGPHKFTQIIFTGCCPVSIAMGGHPCPISFMYEPIPIEGLAAKIKELASKEGCFIYIRNCMEYAHRQGIRDKEAHQKFIDIFTLNNIVQVHEEEMHPPMKITSPVPPEEFPNIGTPAMWREENGALIFFAKASV